MENLINKDMLSEAHRRYFEEVAALTLETADRDIELVVTEKQKTHRYIRLYLSNEEDLTCGDVVRIKYNEECLESIFVAYSKKGMEQEKMNDFDDILNYEPEDNKRCLCLAIDEDHVNNGTDIDFIQTLFKWSKHFDYQILKRDDLKFSTDKIDNLLYFDIEF